MLKPSLRQPRVTRSDRIEMISGPGATIRGANAINGVVNAVTQPAARPGTPDATSGGASLPGRINRRLGGRPELTAKAGPGAGAERPEAAAAPARPHARFHAACRNA